jgi:hypothetical protein
VRKIEAAGEFFVDPHEWNTLDPSVPDDLLNKVHRETDRIHIGRQHKHASDAAGVELVSFFPGGRQHLPMEAVERHHASDQTLLRKMGKVRGARLE